MTQLLTDDNVQLILPKVVAKIGFNEAVILQQIHYWLLKSDKVHDGRVWTYNTIAQWQKQFSYMSTKTIERTMKSLKNQGVLITGNYNKENYDKTIWYTIDYDKFYALGFEKPIDKMSEAYRQNVDTPIDKMSEPIPEISITNISSKNINHSSSLKRFKVKRKKKETPLPSFEPKDKEKTTSGKVDRNEIYRKYNYQQNKDQYLFDSILDGIVNILQGKDEILHDRINSYTESDLLWLSESMKNKTIYSIPNYIYERLVNLKSDIQLANNKVDSKPRQTKWKVIKVDTEDAREYDDDFYNSLYKNPIKKKADTEPNNLNDVFESIRSQLRVV